ncbi:hypothetical protein [Campylobacter anatolicus]|nr:hypothetical protein [Campylobacter anatolicus]
MSVSSEYIDENERRFYELNVEYDLGLEAGTLMSNDDSLLN